MVRLQFWQLVFPRLCVREGEGVYGELLAGRVRQLASELADCRVMVQHFALCLAHLCCRDAGALLIALGRQPACATRGRCRGRTIRGK